MARASVPLVTVVLIMAVLVSRDFAYDMLLGKIIRDCFVIASRAHIRAFRRWQCVS